MKKEPKGLVDLFSNRQRALNSTILACAWGGACLMFYILIFYLKQLPGTIFMNGIYMGIADCCAIIFYTIWLFYFSSKSCL